MHSTNNPIRPASFWWSHIPSLSIALALAVPSPLIAQTVLTFEDLTAKTNVTTQYGARGVVFPHAAFLDLDPHARSGNRVLRAGDPAHEFHQGPFVIQFTAPQRRVRLFAGTTLSAAPIAGTLRAFNSAGQMILQDGPKTVAPRLFTTLFEVSTATAQIVRVELEMPPAEFEAIDDLEFEGQPAPPVPGTAPQVLISAPAESAALDLTGPLNVQGTVTGAGLMPTALLIVHELRPPESTAPPFVTSLPLIGTGTQRTFAMPVQLRSLGPLTLTVQAENSGGLTGSTAVHISNLPSSIRTRYAQAGGLATFGDFRFGLDDGSCRIAVYQRGLVAAAGGAALISVGDIFVKWLSLRDQFGASQLGCPTDEERTGLGQSRRQDFGRGRIYAKLTAGARYVPAPFVQVLDGLGGEAATGIPMADPLSSIATKTWLFQQYVRPGPAGLPSTLEIKGEPPTLWVERQLSASGAPVTNTSPTIWQGFACAANLGPCNLSMPIPTAPLLKGAPLTDAQGVCSRAGGFLTGTTYPWGPPEWKAIVGDYELTPLRGLVKSAYISGEDNPLVHEYSNDWDMMIEPLGPFVALAAPGSGGLIELELEAYFVMFFFATYDQSRPGDLLFASGRWIVDCGHNDYHSEIHPPSVMAHMRTEQFEGRPATAAYLWVGGFYTGEPVDVEIYPPPRPSPEASLVVSKPLDAEAARDVHLEDSAVSLTYVRVRFTASPRHVPITDDGEMKWASGRGYEGKWHVFWSGSHD